MRIALFTGALLIGAVAGCATSPKPATTPSAPATSAAPGAAPVRVTLASEQLRLSALFRGTPVVFAMQSDGGLRVVVPLRHCFDPAGVAVKPPLAAVLDRVATSQRNETTLLRVSAAADPGATDAALARGRAQSTRDYLVAHGIKATRLTVTGATHTEGVQIVVAEVSQR